MSDCDCGSACPQGACLVRIARSGPVLDPRQTQAAFVAESGYQVFRGPRFTGRWFRWGEGPPLVLGHGLSDSSQSFIALASLLRDRFTCIGWDMPATRGEGLDRLPWLRHHHLAEHLLSLLDFLGMDKAHLLGCSFGSTVAIDALRRYPHRFGKAVLQGGFAYRPLSALQRLVVSLGRFARRPLMRHMPRYEQFLRKSNGEGFAGRDPDWWRQLVESTGPTPVKTVCHQARWLDTVDFRGWLPGISLPVLLVHGDRDRLVGLSCRQVLKAGLPNAREVLLAGCGHVPCYTDTEAFAAVVADFLQNDPAPGAR